MDENNLNNTQQSKDNNLQSNEKPSNESANPDRSNSTLPNENPKTDNESLDTDQECIQKAHLPANSLNNSPKQKPPKKKIDNGLLTFLIIIGSILVILLLGIIARCSLPFFFNGKNIANIANEVEKYISTPSESGQSTLDNNFTFDPNGPKINIVEGNDNESSLSAEQVYKNVSPAVVGIVIYENSADVESDPAGQGSGIIISSDGYILTNSHVIGDSKKYKVKIVTNDSSEYSGTVVGYDTRTDLAVVKIDAHGLTAAEFGDSNNINVGSWVIAIGNPGGMDFANSLTRGVVSALNRSVPSSSSVKYIQTDAAINPGNSGGALVNMNGRVIGINTSKIVATGFEGMGFAIPINTAKSVVDDIISQGYVSGRVRLGMTGKVVSSYQSQLYSVPQGIIVVNISNDSDLNSKGVEVGDIITKIDDVQITSFDILYSELAKHSPNEEVNLSIYRPKTEKGGESSFNISVKVLEDKGQTQN